MITKDSRTYRAVCQRVNGGAGGGWCGVVAGVGDDGGDGVWGAVGDGGPDGDLVHVFAVEKLDVECLVEGGLDAFGQPAEVPGEQGDGVEEFGVVVACGGGVDAGDLGFDVLAFSVQFGEPFVAAGAHGLGGCVGRVG